MKARKLLLRLIGAGAGLMAVGCLAVWGVNTHVKTVGSSHIVEVEAAPEADAILVPGAYVHPTGRVSDILHDRLVVALDLYKQGKASKLIVSGDHGQTDYDEVNAMKAFLIEQGVPGSDIFMDHAGFSTYESVYRARDIFQAKRLLIVTQEYHLMRALYIADQLGIAANGVTSDRNRYRKMAVFEARETAARVKDFIYASIWKPKPTYLGEAIPVTGDGGATDDK